MLASSKFRYYGVTLFPNSQLQSLNAGGVTAETRLSPPGALKSANELGKSTEQKYKRNTFLFFTPIFLNISPLRGLGGGEEGYEMMIKR